MRLWIALLLLFPSIALANTATVRSGEHGNFTRFVIALEQSAAFSTEAGAREFTVGLPGIESVRLDQAFERVERDRVTDITFSAGVLRFSKGCPCLEQVYAIGTNLIVVDVYDPGVDLPDLAQPAPAIIPQPGATGDNRQLSNTLPIVLTDRPARSGLDLFSTQTEPRLAEGRQAESLSPLDGPQAEARLAQDIGAALTQGVLSFDSAGDRRRVSDVAPKQDDGPSDNEDAILHIGGVAEQDGFANLRTSGPIDGLTQGHGNTGQPGIASDCSNGRDYALPDWVPDTGFNEAVSELRRNLVLEFDAVDSEVALDLARTYVAFGFGAEAISVLDLAEDRSSAFEAARGIAKVIEYGVVPGEEMPVAQLECAGGMSFWAALSMENLPRDVLFDEDAAIRELNAMPKYLRAVLAPELSKRLRQRGSVSKASLIMRGAARSEEKLSTKGQIEANELREDDVRTDSHEEPLFSMLADGAEEAPIALISFIKKQVRNGKEIGPETALLAESYALQFRGTEIEKDLIAAQMIALAKSGQFKEAISLLRASPLPSETYNDAIADLFLTLIDAADDVTFLKYALLPLEEKQMAVEEDIRLRMAERALNLGFDKVAERLLATIVKRKTARSYERLMGELMLQQGRYDLALGFLERADDGEVSPKRAEAFFGSGQFETAAQAFDQIGLSEAEYEAAFRSRSIPVTDAEYAASIEALRRLQNPLPETEGVTDAATLEAANSLVSASAALVSDTRLLMSATEF